MQGTRNWCSRNCSEEKILGWCHVLVLFWPPKEAVVRSNSRITLTPAAPWSHQEELLNFSRKPFYPFADTLSNRVVCHTINHVLICRCFMDSKFFLQKHRTHPPRAGCCVHTLHWTKQAQSHIFPLFHTWLTQSCWPQIRASWAGNHTVLLPCQLLGVADLLILIPSRWHVPDLPRLELP